MTHPIVQRREAERAERIEQARVWAAGLDRHLGVVAAVVFGSVARGDFNKWSDLDVLVVAQDLPADGRSRLELLTAGRPPGLEPLGWTPEELGERRRRRDPIALECDAVGVVVLGALP
ncbi:MAG: nucleotidyltransferase domain-containing protein [Actinomycetota bacterium]